MSARIPTLFLCVYLTQTSLVADNSKGSDLNCLIKAYPQHLCGKTQHTLIGCDGTQFPVQIYRADPSRSLAEMLQKPDLLSQMQQQYPLKIGPHFRPKQDQDPGRIRYQPFFDYMYGSSKQAVKKQLQPVRWLPSLSKQRILVTRVNQVHHKLQSVSNELDKAPLELRQIAKNILGAFAHRTIAGTRRKSTHSYGIAIDLGGKRANYWRWELHNGKNPKYRNRIPAKIVSIFEKHGFIWGGKWYHYDTMHFEYRPELLLENCKI